jgi:hypothetical protein
MCYGVKIDALNICQKIFKLTISDYVAGVYENNECIGICTQQYWTRLPVWTISNLYLKKRTDNVYMGKNQLSIIGLMMDHTTSIAESRGYFEFYYVIRDNINGIARKKQGFDHISISNPMVATKYRFENMHLINNKSDLKWPYVHDLIGSIGLSALEKSKSLIIRRATLLPEYRL